MHYINFNAVIISRIPASTSNGGLVLLGNIHLIIEHKSDAANKCKRRPSISLATQALFIHNCVYSHTFLRYNQVTLLRKAFIN
jgi:hypothetical protein